MSIPSTIKRNHILKAIQELKSLGEKAVPLRHRSRKYDVHVAGRKYPPKFLIAFASKFVDGPQLSTRHFSGGPEANNFLITHGFRVFNRFTGKKIGIEPVSESDETSFPEGKIKYRQHIQRERNPRLIKLAKEQRLKKAGDLACDACNFSFHKTYGDLGAGFIEAHHTIPISEYTRVRKTKITDLALVCSNCHRMLHRRRPWLRIHQLRQLRFKP